MTFAITGASGQLARLAADRLLARVDAAEVVLLTRTPSSLQSYADRGVAVRAADFDDPSSLAAAFAGVDRVLLISTDASGSPVDRHRAAIDAARAAGVSRMAYTSVAQPVADNPALVVADHAATEQDLRNSGLEWVLLRNNLYAHNQLPTIAQAAASGRLVTNTGSGAAAYVAREDCAAAAAGALLDDTVTNTAIGITGPEAIGAADLAELAAKVAGHAIELVDVDDAAYTAGLVAAGLPQSVAAFLASFGAAIRGGYFADVTSTVRDLGGVTPTPLSSLL